MATDATEHKLGKHRRPFRGCPLCYPSTMEIVSAEVVKPKRAPKPKPATAAVIEYDDTAKRLHVVTAPKAEIAVAIADLTEPWALATPLHPGAETREAWLLRAVDALRPWFPAGTPVPDVRVSMGFPAGRGSSKLIGQCWYTTDDKAPALFVSPELSATTDIVTTLLHEMVHAAVGPKVGHKGAFRKVAMGLGFEAPMRSSPASEPLKARLAQMAWELGAFPHSAVNKIVKGTTRDVQATRMLKVACVECGCLIRMTRKWLDEVGAPVCRCGGEMMEGIA